MKNNMKQMVMAFVMSIGFMGGMHYVHARLPVNLLEAYDTTEKQKDEKYANNFQVIVCEMLKEHQVFEIQQDGSWKFNANAFLDFCTTGVDKSTRAYNFYTRWVTDVSVHHGRDKAIVAGSLASVVLRPILAAIIVGWHDVFVDKKTAQEQVRTLMGKIDTDQGISSEAFLNNLDCYFEGYMDAKSGRQSKSDEKRRVMTTALNRVLNKDDLPEAQSSRGLALLQLPEGFKKHVYASVMGLSIYGYDLYGKCLLGSCTVQNDALLYVAVYAALSELGMEVFKRLWCTKLND